MKRFLFLSLFCFFSLQIISQHKGGLIFQNQGSLQGYVLFAPLHSKTTYLIDKCGRQVHTWQSNYPPGQSVYLLGNGDLLRTANDSNRAFKGGGTIERYNWNNKLLWTYKISSANECQHHDICALPNGNVLALVWEKKTKEDAVKAGRTVNLASDLVWSEKIVELKPSGKTDAKIIWEWHVWDHLVQENDSSKNNYGKVSSNPQLLDINYYGYKEPDWFHFNAIAYNPELDQILVSNRNYSEIFIIDHSTTSVEASSHIGGKSNKGGDLLYRYGNPRALKSGTEADQIFFAQHHAHWIEHGLKDEGKIMVFNNGLGRRTSIFSSVDIITPAVDNSRNYRINEGNMSRFYSEQETSETGGNFYSSNVSSAQRLSNGNILVCSGATGRFCEFNENKEIVWLYMNPVTAKGIVNNQDPDMNQVFRCTFYLPNYSAFKGRKLIPGKPIEKETASDCFPVYTGVRPSTGR